MLKRLCRSDKELLIGRLVSLPRPCDVALVETRSKVLGFLDAAAILQAESDKAVPFPAQSRGAKLAPQFEHPVFVPLPRSLSRRPSSSTRATSRVLHRRVSAQRPQSIAE